MSQQITKGFRSFGKWVDNNFKTSVPITASRARETRKDCGNCERSISRNLEVKKKKNLKTKKKHFHLHEFVIQLVTLLQTMHKPLKTICDSKQEVTERRENFNLVSELKFVEYSSLRFHKWKLIPIRKKMLALCRTVRRNN